MKKLIDGTIHILSKNNPEIEKNRVAYAYGLDLFFSSFFNLLGILLAHALMGSGSEIVVVILFFALIRTFSGGYHAKSRVNCFLFFLLLSLGAIKVAHYIMAVDGALKFILGVIPCIGFIGIFAPLDTSAKRLSIDQKKKYKKQSFLMVLFLVGIIFLMYYLSMVEFSVLGALGIYLAVLTMLIRLIQKELKGELIYESKVI